MYAGGACPTSEKSLLAPALHGPFDLALMFAFFDILPLVVLFLAGGDRNFQFGEVMFEIHAQWDDGDAFLRDEAGQPANLPLMQQ